MADAQTRKRAVKSGSERPDVSSSPCWIRRVVVRFRTLNGRRPTSVNRSPNEYATLSVKRFSISASRPTISPDAGSETPFSLSKRSQSSASRNWPGA